MNFFQVLSKFLTFQTKANFAEFLQIIFVTVGFRDHTLEGGEFTQNRSVNDERTQQWKQHSAPQEVLPDHPQFPRLNTKQFGLPKPKGPQGRQAFWLQTVFYRRVLSEILELLKDNLLKR